MPSSRRLAESSSSWESFTMGQLATGPCSWRTREVIIFGVLLAVAIPPTFAGLVLNEFVQYFEPVYYDKEALKREHHRVKRDATPYLRLQFTAHNRLFKLRLQKDPLFADDVVFETTKGPVSFDTSKVYTGQLEDDDQSFVQGIVTHNGLFDGTISTSLESYYVEPAATYFADDAPFHSVAYKSSDVRQPNRQTCLSHELYLKRREETYGGPSPKSFLVARNNDTAHVRNACYEFGSCSEAKHRAARRTKRAVVDPKKTTCMLYLQADHLFYEKFGSEEACIEIITRHVQRVNSIYNVADFDQDGKSDSISFTIKRIKVHTSEAINDPTYRFPGNYGVEKFLELFSEEDYDAFCLAYMFTYRDFEGGTLGLAWTGDLKNAGGVCEKNGHYRGSLKSLNTGIVTLLNYGKHVPPAVSHVTLAHEVGHNFGSPHDPEQNKICTPGGDNGNYIMFARATSGDKRNNNKFSPCSLNSINPVLNAKARDSKGCFTEPQAAICGNGVVETGEECDCGWEEDCKEDCCFPMRTYVPHDMHPCRLRPGKACSPSQGPCCTQDCHVKFGDKCRDDNGCRDTSFCSGRGPRCPPSTNKPNKTVCNDEFVCFMGECTGSICLAYGLESCQCVPGPGEPVTKACELCCKLPGDDKPCLSSFDWNAPPYDVPDMFAKPGTPCNNYNGYCDVFQKCREVDPSGPLATLRKLLLSDESIASFKRWLISHWYAVAFAFIGVAVILLAIVRFFGKVSTFRSLKGTTIFHSSSREGVPLDTANLTVHPTAVRKKLPLKRKVRERHHHSSPSHKPHGGHCAKKKGVRSSNKGKPCPKRDEDSSQPQLPSKSSVDVDAVLPSAAIDVTKSVPVKRSTKPKQETGVSTAQSHSEQVTKQDKQNTASSTDHPTPKKITTHEALMAKLPRAKGNKKRSSSSGKTRSRRKSSPTKATSPGTSKGLLSNKTSTKKAEVCLQMVYKPPFKLSFQITTNDKGKTVGEGKGSKDCPAAVTTPGREVAGSAGKRKHVGRSRSGTRKQAAKVCPSSSTEPVILPGELAFSGKDHELKNTSLSGSTELAQLPGHDSVAVSIPSDLEVLFSESETLLSDNEGTSSNAWNNKRRTLCLASTPDRSSYEDSCV